jgi:hypothetical protein
MPRTKKPSPATEASTPTIEAGKQPEPMTMAQMAEMTTDGKWLTLSDATSYANRSKATLRSAFGKYPAIFGDQAVRLIEIKGTGYPPLLYIAKDAIDKYIAERDSAPDGVTHQRASRGVGRKYTVYIADDKLETAKAWAAEQGLEFKLAFTPKAKGTADSAASQPATDQAPAAVNELELVSA